jgi:ferredoxin
MYKINFKKDDCVGCGACVAVCSENWDLEDGKAHPKESQVEDIGCNQEAADTCPLQCIEIVKE